MTQEWSDQTLFSIAVLMYLSNSPFCKLFFLTTKLNHPTLKMFRRNTIHFRLVHTRYIANYWHIFKKQNSRSKYRHVHHCKRTLQYITPDILWNTTTLYNVSYSKIIIVTLIHWLVRSLIIIVALPVARQLGLISLTNLYNVVLF